jgi:UDP-2-acetamido-3-amino-2,3-dideoxy-glucuronate N-acetyltransferase
VRYLSEAPFLALVREPKGIPIMAINDDVRLGKDVKIFHPHLVNLYGCEIGDQTKIGSFVEIQKNVIVGSRCKISSHSFLCEGVVIEDEVFVGHGVMFTNDPYPRATNEDGSLQTEADWIAVKTIVNHGASIGSNATILAGVKIGKKALIGAGAVVTHSVPDYAIVVGVPARIIGDVRDREQALSITTV